MNRVLPHNLEAERALLGAILLNNTAYDRVADVVKPEQFAEVGNGVIFDAMATLINQGQRADGIKLRHLESDPNVQRLGGMTYIAQLLSSATTASSARDYGQAVRRLFMARETIRVAEAISDAAYGVTPAEDPADLLAQGSAAFDAILEGAESSSLTQIGSAARNAVQRAQEAVENGGRVSGLTTGLADLDRLTGGFNPGELIVLAARPGMGKTALAIAIAYQVAKQGVPVGFFSLEMPSEQIARRLLCVMTGVPLGKIKHGDLDKRELESLNSAAAAMGRLPLYINDAAGLHPAAVRARARALKRRHGRGLTIVDHIQIMRGGERHQNRTAEITEISMGLKAAAKELEGPVLALAQLNRSVESRDDKRPTLADLRESGSIEQDADAVLFIYREEYYHRQKEPNRESPSERNKHYDWQADLEEMKGKAEVIAAKQRDGEVGRCDLFFDAERVTFGNLERERVPA